MKKRDRLIKMDNVILFPDYDKRLMEKGLDRLHEKNIEKQLNCYQKLSVLILMVRIYTLDWF